MGRRRLSELREGLSAGVHASGIADLGVGIGEGLQAAWEWRAGSLLATPQPCSLCGKGPYSRISGLVSHVERAHYGLSSRERGQLYDKARLAGRVVVHTEGGSR